MNKTSAAKNSEVLGCSFRAFVIFLLQLLGRIRQAVMSLGGSAGCASALESSSGHRGPSPRLYPLKGVYCLVPEAPLKRGMPTRPKVFLALPDACGLRPCDRTHLKNGLVPHSCISGTYDKYRGPRTLSGATRLVV